MKVTMSMRRWVQAYKEEFLAMVTEGVVHGLYKVVTRPSFCVDRRQVEINGCFAIVSKLCIQTWDSSWRTEEFWPMPITTDYTTSGVMDTPKLRRYEAYLEMVLLQSVTGALEASWKATISKS